MAMDPVNKKALKKDFEDRADKDIDNDGDTDSTDKYLHARRKAVSKAISKMKESVAVFESHFKVGDEVECIKSGMEGKVIEVDPEEKGKYYTVKREDGKIMKYAPDELRAEDEDDDEDEDEEDEMDEAWKKDSGWKKPTVHKDKYGNVIKTKNVAKSLAKSAAKQSAGEKMADRNAAHKFRKMNKEEVEKLDELSPNTLHRYIKKASGNLAGNAAVAATQASSSMKKSSPDVKRKMVNRMKGITGASGRLADKANMAEEVELDEDVRKMTHGRLKFHMNNKHIPHGSYSWDQMKAERDRRLKTGQGEAYKKAKMSMSEEAQLDEVLDTPKAMDSYRNKAKYSKERAANSAVAKIFRSKDKETREHPAKELKTIAKRTAGQQMADRAAARKYRQSLRKEEVELDEVLKVSDGMGAWIDDFKKSDAPQFKGKDDKERREMAIAAYLAAKRKNK